MTNPFDKNPLISEEDEKAPEAPAQEETEKAEAKVSEAPKKAAPPKSGEKPKKLTAAQERDLLAKQVEELKAALEAKVDAADIKIFRDEIIAEGGVGGQTRLVGNGRTLVNKDWRLSIDGLRVLVGRSSMQAQTHFQIPVSLVESLADLLGHFDKIRDK